MNKYSIILLSQCFRSVTLDVLFFIFSDRPYQDSYALRQTESLQNEKIFFNKISI